MEIMADKEVLLKTLEDLADEEFKKFKWFLQDPVILVGSQAIPKNQLENAERTDTVDKIIQTFSHQSVEVVKKVLKKIHRNDLVEKLSSISTGEQDVFQRRKSEACSLPNTLLEVPVSPQIPTPPQTTSPSATTLPGPSKPTALLQSPPVDKAQDTSSKFNNIPKYLIQSGSPTLYQLIPRKEKIGTLTRMTLGEKDPNKINKTILLVGETGAGKSTLINALVNYAMGVEWEDDVWFKIVKDGENRSGTQTSDVIVYQIFGFEDKTLPYSLTIIDTPGYGTTDGLEHNAIISQRLLDLFQSDDELHKIDTVGLVMKASDNRLNDQMRYIFNSVASLFGKNIEKNIVALITHSDGVTAKNVLQVLGAAKFRCAKDEKNQPVHFLFDNSQYELRTENTMYLKNADEISMKGMSQFTDFMNITLHQNLKTTVEVLKARIGLTDGIKNLQERIQSIDLKQEEIKQTQKALNKHKEEMNKNEKFTEEVDEVYRDKEPVDERRWWWLWLNHGGAVCCTVCKENCHYPCTLTLIPEFCDVMKYGHCIKCKCPASDHAKRRKIYKEKTRKVEKILEDVKEKYEKGRAGFEEAKSLLETLEKNMEGLQKDKDWFLEESFQHVVKLEQIALKVDAVSTHVHLDFLIEKMKEKGDMEKKRKLEEMKSQMDKDKGIKASRRYSRR